MTARAMAVLQAHAEAELLAQGGYLVEQAGGMLLCAFPKACAGVRWALATLQLCLLADWPEVGGHGRAAHAWRAHSAATAPLWEPDPMGPAAIARCTEQNRATARGCDAIVLLTMKQLYRSRTHPPHRAGAAGP